jgi:hypothetical protein
MAAYQPAISQKNTGVEIEMRALMERFFESYNNRNLDALMDCFGKPEGFFINGGQTYSLDSIKVIWPRDYWGKRKEEKFWLEDVRIVNEGKNSHTIQVTYSARYIYIPTEATWEFNKSAFMTCVVNKQDGKWKIVACHWSASGKQTPKSKG